MKNLLSRLWTETSGVLSFEWITLNSVVALGVVGGLSSVRDALNDEMADMTEAITSLDQSYTIQPPRCVAVINRNDREQIGMTVKTGMGYSTSEWNALVQSHPELANQRNRIQTTSGGVGSRFIDRKPDLDNGDVEIQRSFSDPAKIDDSVAPPANKQ